MTAITHRLSFRRSITLQSSSAPPPKGTTKLGHQSKNNIHNQLWKCLKLFRCQGDTFKRSYLFIGFHKLILGLQPAPSQFSARHVIAPPISKRNKCRVLCRWPTGLSLYTSATSNSTFRHFFIHTSLLVYLFRSYFGLFSHIHANSTKIVSAYHAEGVYLYIYICK